MKKKVAIYDTLLRDGNQAKGISFSLQDKLAVTGLLDKFGIDYIEGGWPNASSSLDVEYFREVRKRELKHAKICAFGSTRKPGSTPGKDEGLKYLVQSKTPVITIFGKSWDLHVTQVLRTSQKKNLEMIRDSVAYLKQHCDEVIFDAEHFFDGYITNADYAIKTLAAAEQGGADCLVLCDTNGGMGLPWEVERIFAEVSGLFKCALGIHAHNDSGTGVANSLAAVRGGACHVQGTINGYGERCGNTNLSVLIPGIQLKMNRRATTGKKLRNLRTLCLSVSEIANMAEDIRQPYVGAAAFAHKGGMHIDGVRKVSRSFEHIEPESVGNIRDFIVSGQSGASLVLEKIKQIKPGVEKSDPQVQELVRTVKKLEGEGYQFEVADGSFELLARRAFGMIKEQFKVLSYRVIEENRKNGDLYSEATAKIQVKNTISHMCAEGNGPVDAMAKAVRRSLRPYYPELDDVKLQDYKVRVLDDQKGTGSKVRVWIRFHDESKKKNVTWGTIGVSANIIEASLTALVDGFHYKLMGRS